MIFKAQTITWDLKPGVKLPFGPEDDFIPDEQSVNDDSNVKVQEINQESKDRPLIETVAVESRQNTVVAPAPMVDNAQAYVSTNELIQNLPSQDFSIQKNFEQEMVEPLQINKDNSPVEPAVNTFSQPQNNVPLQNNPLAENIAPVSLQPILNDNTLYNVATSEPMVDGVAITTTQNNQLQSNLPRWTQLPYKLRQKRADVFVNSKSGVDYISSLVAFLKSKNLDVKEYDDSVHYLPSDILLLDSSDVVDAGTVYVLQNGKKYIWDALQKELGDKLNGK